MVSSVAAEFLAKANLDDEQQTAVAAVAVARQVCDQVTWTPG